MHPIYLVGAGLLLLLLFILGARLLKISFARLMPAYLIIWFIAAAVNMWVGVTKAGFSVIQEIPFFLIVFGVPAIVALLVARRV